MVFVAPPAHMRWRLLLPLLLLLLFSQPLGAYSVFTHQELIDLAWTDGIRTLLLNRFPGTTPAQLREAHAYAYGGCLIQDMGYYPFGKKFFSNLTHYARSGDFVVNLFRNARDVNECAFAVGALSHYVGDSIGHSRAVNPATGVEFPKLEQKFGPNVNYGESPHGHIRTEFAFDIGQLAKKTFAPPSYMRPVGFRVPRKLIERAFLQTYGFDIHELSGPRFEPVLRSYRTSVRSFIPAFAGAEIVLHRKQFPADPQDDAYRMFSARLSRADYERHWKYPYPSPGFGSHLLAIVVKVIPKIGAISDLAIKAPNAQTEDWYIRSVNESLDRFGQLLSDLRTKNVLPVPNRDLDTGAAVKPGAYPLADMTYAQLLHRIVSKPDRLVPIGVHRDLLRYYSDPNAPIVTKKDPHAWQAVLSELHTLEKMKTVRTSGLPEAISEEDRSHQQKGSPQAAIPIGPQTNLCDPASFNFAVFRWNIILGPHFALLVESLRGGYMLRVDPHAAPDSAFSVVQRNHCLLRPSPGYLFTSLFGPAKRIDQTHRVLPRDFSGNWDAKPRLLETAAG